MRSVLSALRLMLFLLGTFVLVPVHIVIKTATGSMVCVRIWPRMVRFMFGIRLRFVGQPFYDAAIRTAFLSNHISYLDIIILASRLDASFVAKSEVASWPLFGFLARLQNTVFVDRRRTATAASRTAIGHALNNKKRNVIIFPEGTSTDGRSVAPFKSALLDVFLDAGAGVRVQPVAIVLDAVDGRRPDDQSTRDLYAWWWPETTLVPHLWAFGRVWRTDLTVHFLEPFEISRFADRKALAKAAHDMVCAVVEAGVKPPFTDVPVAQLDRAMVS